MEPCFGDVLLREHVLSLNVVNCIFGGWMALIGNVVILQPQKKVEQFDSWKRSVAISHRE